MVKIHKHAASKKSVKNCVKTAVISVKLHKFTAARKVPKIC